MDQEMNDIVPEDLSLEERDELSNIRRRKKELLDDIERLKFEIAEVMTEIEQLTCGIQFLGLENDLLHTLLRSIPVPLQRRGPQQNCPRGLLRERDDFNLKVLQAFVDLHEFADLNLVQALRLHNPNVRDKPPVERFISMNRGINEGGDLPEDLLRNLYESIKSEPFKIPEDDGNDLTHTFFNPDREGWLLKLG
ncbi:unnamed protein product [Coregonus sp. 'balchen']|nr:unnamed protein product [Coregonus sp. 'balchen']